MTYTKHGHYIEGSPNVEAAPTARARCGGPGLCSKCTDEQKRFDELFNNKNGVNEFRRIGNEHHEPIAAMNEDTNYQVRARYTLIKYIDNDFQKRGIPAPAYEVYIVWFCKVLQNWKAILGTTMPDGMLYEMTYNGNEDVVYVDAYRKIENTTMKVEFE